MGGRDGGAGGRGGGWKGGKGVKGARGEQLWRHSQMKSNLIVITVAAGLITTTGTIIRPMYSQHSSISPPFFRSYLASLHPGQNNTN